MSGTGHVFVARGDLRRLHCDAWLLPTDRGLQVEAPWLDGATPRRLELEVPAGWREGRSRAIAWERPDGGPQAWLVDVGGHAETPTDWYMEGVRQFIRSAAEDLRARPERRQTAPEDRRRPLLAVPVVGTGAGGQALNKAVVLRLLLETLQASADAAEVDVALVAFNEASFAAAQRARRELGVQIGAALSSELRAVTERLAARTLAGELVLFLGAGVSKGAGLPLWWSLLEELATEAGFDAAQRAALARMDPLDQARLIELQLGDRAALEAAITRRLHGERHSLAHALLAGLPVDAVVTLNYDQLFELAATAAGDPVAVLPTTPSGEVGRWLLKLHGCVSRPADIVLTREDYLRYSDRRAALVGIVQALLLTRHMLFVGFGLDDVNFHRIADDVRKALGPRRQSAPTFGTSLTLGEQPLQQRLWRGDLELAAVDAGDNRPARSLEIVLDALLHATSHRPSYLLRPEFDAMLSDAERDFRDDVAALQRKHAGRLDESAAWARFEQLLTALGRPGRAR